ncbi:MAG: lysozyme inhibitor LprI family protein [Aeromonas sp.]
MFLLILVISTDAFSLNCANVISTQDINECGRIEMGKTEKELNIVYQRVISQLKKISKGASVTDKSALPDKLIQAQRFWIKFRESDCGAVYTFWSDGSIRGAMYTSCMQQRAQQRIEELKEYEKID